MVNFKLKYVLLISILVFAVAQAVPAACPEDGATPFMAGPVNPDNGFAFFVKDSNNLSLQLCLDGDGVTGPCFFDPPVAGNAFSQQIGFGAEAFWWLADTIIPLPRGGRALLVMAAEAAFLTEDPIDGDQFPFTRLRIRLDVPAPGVYTVVHPYGEATFVIDVVGAGDEVRESFDIEFTPNTTNQGRVGPWLTWDASAPAPPAGYIGDINIPHAVTGSPCGNNFFSIQAPGVDLGEGAGNAVVETLFNVAGKIATQFGANVSEVNYNRAANGSGRVNFFVDTNPGQTLQAEFIGIPNRIREMVEDAGRPGHYYARIPFNAAGGNFPVNGVQVTNTTDVPPSVTNVVTPVDRVEVVRALYTLGAARTGAGTFEVRANTSELQEAVTLTAYQADGVTEIGPLDTPVNASTVSGTFAMTSPPSTVIVKSNFGGSGSRIVRINGPIVP